MSLATIELKLELAEHSTAAWIQKTLLEVEGKAPEITSVVDTSIKYIGLCLQIGLGAAGNTAAASVVGTVAAQAQRDLTAVSATVADFGATPTAASAFAAIQTNLGTILTDANVKDPTTIASVTKAINEVGTLGAAVSTAATAIQASVDAANQPAVGEPAPDPAPAPTA